MVKIKELSLAKNNDFWLAKSDQWTNTELYQYNDAISQQLLKHNDCRDFLLYIRLKWMDKRLGLGIKIIDIECVLLSFLNQKICRHKMADL
jgi:hypothetical protein